MKRLGEVVTVNSGKDYKHLSTGNIPVYGTGGYMLSVNDRLSDIDAVGIGRKGTIDKPQYLRAPFWTVDTLFFLTTKENYDLRFVFNLSQLVEWKKYSEQTGVPSLTSKSINNIQIAVPPLPEQQRIVSVLSLWDTAIAKQTALIEKLTLRKRGLMQQLLTGKKRLKGFEGEWKTIELGDALSYIQPTKYLVCNENYNDSYDTPVLTAGKTFILGYTNEKTGIFDDFPAIIFDDFTTESKYVSFPFKAKSSAMKILKAKDSNLYYMFCVMQIIKYSIGGHERNWISKYSHLTIKAPSIEEQNAIAFTLINADKEIEIQKQKLAAMQEQKRGLMQVLLTGKKRIK